MNHIIATARTADLIAAHEQAEKMAALMRELGHEDRAQDWDEYRDAVEFEMGARD